MRVYGSITNRINETVKPLIPTVGMGATIIYWSDRSAGTIIEVNAKGTRIVVQKDKAVRTDKNGGYSEDQDYTYKPNPKGQTWVFTKRKNGAFYEQGSAMKNGTIARIGVRDEYTDPSF